MTQTRLDADALARIETPAVVVDLDRVDANIARMATYMRDRDVALRPHAKTHKSLELGRRQLAAGAVGLTVATIGEAEVFAAGGIDDLFIAYPLIADRGKAERLRQLAERATLSIGVDSTTGAEAIAAAVRGAARRPRILVEIDCGGRRTGVLPDAAGDLAVRCRALGLEVVGVFTHAGHAYAGPEARAGAASDEVSGLAAAADSLRAEAIEPIVVSAGSTPTAMLSARDVVTEERPGTYVFGDRLQAALAGDPESGVALLVAATVVSHGARGGFVVDAGAKILAKDVAPFIDGHGAVLGWDATISRVSDHHGVVELPAGAARPAIGEVVLVVPNHVCPVVNLVDEYLVVRDGRLVDRWPVDARGRNS
ncbi:MAG TPA: alanine racemase [Candidatus Limnocylindrales bacterium]